MMMMMMMIDDHDDYDDFDNDLQMTKTHIYSSTICDMHIIKQ